MPKLFEDLEGVLPVFPVIWNDFCKHEGEASRPWEAKLNDDVRCLDREWRKLVFKLFDYMRMALRLPNHHYHGDKRRLETIVYPFRYHYARSFSDRDAPRASPNPLFATTTYSEWPWLPNDIADALADEPRMVRDFAMAFNTIDNRFKHLCNGTETYQEAVWNCFVACLEKADEHDLGRLIFGAMNSIARSAILAIPDARLREIMGTIQTLVDHRVTNCNALRHIIFELVAKRGLLPSTMKVAGTVKWEASYTGEPRAGGGMADIFLGKYQGKKVALKKVRLMYNREALRQAQRREAIIWRQLKHCNIMPLIGICDNLIPGCDLLVSPWMENGDLATFIKSVEAAGGMIDGQEFMRQIASGLLYLHEQDPQIIHCDLRASNVVVGEDYRLLLIDFGVAKVERIQTIIMTAGEPQGSFRWMAPELLMTAEDGKGPILSTKTDVYAFAMTCIEIFSGTFPYYPSRNDATVLLKVVAGGRPPRPTDELAQKRGLNDAIWSLITSCWHQDPTKRPTVSVILSQLHKASIPFTSSPILVDGSSDFPLDDLLETSNGNGHALSISHTPNFLETPPPEPPSPQLRWISGIFQNIAQNFTSYRSRLPSVSGISDLTSIQHIRGPPSEATDMSEQLLLSPPIKRRRSISPPMPRKALTYSEVVRSRTGAINNGLAQVYSRHTMT